MVSEVKLQHVHKVSCGILVLISCFVTIGCKHCIVVIVLCFGSTEPIKEMRLA